jgi:hypothetical protein
MGSHATQGTAGPPCGVTEHQQRSQAAKDGWATRGERYGPSGHKKEDLDHEQRMKPLALPEAFLFTLSGFPMPFQRLAVSLA